MIRLYFAIVLLMAAVCATRAQKLLNSAHDFSGLEWNIQMNSCNVCHLEIEGSEGSVKAPLWKHNFQEVEYTVYQSATLDAVVKQPDGLSKLCLSCHDGTIALNNFGGSVGNSKYIPSEKLIGTDLRDDHPVSLRYDRGLAERDGRLYDPSNTESGLGSTIAEDLLVNGELQCTSCHDVHNIMGNGKMLVLSNNKSSLCLTCHKK